MRRQRMSTKNLDYIRIEVKFKGVPTETEKNLTIEKYRKQGFAYINFLESSNTFIFERFF